ncbi:hypothetical protein FTUN_2155 [Frigoriglobus tundricola]|uniref:Uncharacterized protein n=1 Tax=Frigoriglobus tundricola TaxID=2774151 RepID=A0A6M5YMW5_9BACT|nr:hypothetical protein FTUN_2155 [Frigoriglobus tundricola]
MDGAKLSGSGFSRRARSQPQTGERPLRTARTWAHNTDK